MKKPKSIQIAIPQPCQEDWNKMTPQEQGRFCDSCQKCVVDFTRFSDKEIYQYLIDNTGKKVCGRFNSSQLNRNILPPPQPHSQLYKWIIAAGLALVFAAVPDSPVFAKAPYIQEQVSCDEKKQIASKKNIQVYGRVFDNKGKAVEGAKVYIFIEDTKIHTITDQYGEFLYSGLDSGTYSIEAYIKGNGVEIKRGIVKNVPIEANYPTFIDVTLSAGDNYFPFVQEYNDQQYMLLGDIALPEDLE